MTEKVQRLLTVARLGGLLELEPHPRWERRLRRFAVCDVSSAYYRKTRQGHSLVAPPANLGAKHASLENLCAQIDAAGGPGGKEGCST